MSGPAWDLFTGIKIVLGLIVLAGLFLWPGGRSRRRAPRRPRRRSGPPPQPGKDWRAAALRLERHLRTLHRRIEEDKKRRRELERALLIEKEKFERLQEKLEQERSWRRRETEEEERRKEALLRVREEIRALEAEAEKEHGIRLRLQRETADLKRDLQAAAVRRRELEGQVDRLEAQVRVYREEIRTLREDNQKLSRRHDESSWVAKSAYTALEVALEETRRELEALRRRFRVGREQES